jgi:uncharacterized protein
MSRKALIENTVSFVRQTLEDAEGGHDWWHIHRVWQTARTIAKQEDADLLIVELGALLHDIADAKFHDGDESIGPAVARAFLSGQQVEETIIAHIENIIRHISYKSSLQRDPDQKGFQSPEFHVIQDADRLDAIGAIGIARAFNYGGYRNRLLYDPDIKPNLNMTKEAYKKSTAPTINHFYEKLLLLKDQMNTETGRKMAKQRHQFMELYLDEFYQEWNGKR